MMRKRSDTQFGEPIESGDQLVIPVSRVGPDGTRALGVFVIGPGRSEWQPVVDANRIALIGVSTGFVAAALSCLAMVIQPPWPTSEAMVEIARNRRARKDAGIRGD